MVHNVPEDSMAFASALESTRMIWEILECNKTIPERFTTFKNVLVRYNSL